jgi:hypothetical protein
MIVLQLFLFCALFTLMVEIGVENNALTAFISIRSLYRKRL